MNKKRISRLFLAAAAVIIGGVIAGFGFELVSIPGYREHNEGAYVFFGLVLAAAGMLSAVFGESR